MKKTTCKNLGGVCEVEITGETLKQMGKNAKRHAMKMMMRGDKAHIAAANKMRQMSKEEQREWYEEFKEGFDALPEA